MISLIVAATKNRMIGEKGDFAWHLPNDFKRFRRLTLGHPVIMGRGTYDHLMQRIGKILPDRPNVVVTRNRQFVAPGATVVHAIDEALQVAKADRQEVFVIGGEQLFASTLPLADRIYLTEVDTHMNGDAFFPKINPAQWREISREPHQKDSRHAYNYTFITLDRVR